jgi:hypothetical protein
METKKIKQRESEVPNIEPPGHILEEDALKYVLEVATKKIPSRAQESAHALMHQPG